MLHPFDEDEPQYREIVLVAGALGADRVGVVTGLKEELREPPDIDALLLADRDQGADFSVVVDLLPDARGGGGCFLNAGKGRGLDQNKAEAKGDYQKSLSHMTLYQRLSRAPMSWQAILLI